MNVKRKRLTKRNLVTFGTALGSGFLMAFSNNIFMEESNILPAGFMGIATLVSLVGKLFSLNISTAIVLTCINLPVALFCLKTISKRFVFFSVIQIVSCSFLLHFLPVYAIFDQTILNVIFGGCIYGFGIALALRGGASTGGTDFIALYVSNKTGREIWMGVFAFNCILIAIFGAIFGWDKAGYSIIFQFVSTRMITTFHTRYKRVMMQIFTKKPEEVVRDYIAAFPHGITEIEGTGGYTGEKTALLVSVTSSYELPEAIEVCKKADPEVIINVTNTDQYIGKFKQPKI